MTIEQLIANLEGLKQQAYRLDGAIQIVQQLITQLQTPAPPTSPTSD